MAKFRFRLQSVLDIQQRREDAARAELAARERERIEEAERLRAAEAHRESGAAKAREAGTGPCPGARLRAHARYVARLADEVKSRENALAQAVDRSETARFRLVDIGRRRHAYERLRDRDLESHRQEERRLDSRHADEVATQQTALRNRRRS